MIVSNFMNGWMALIGPCAVMGLIAIAFYMMVGAIKPGEAMKPIGALICVVILLMILPQIIVNGWAAMSIWQRVCFVAIAVVLGFGIFSAGPVPVRHKHRIRSRR
jgi:hypothetical protein